MVSSKLIAIVNESSDFDELGFDTLLPVAKRFSGGGGPAERQPPGGNPRGPEGFWALPHLAFGGGQRGHLRRSQLAPRKRDSREADQGTPRAGQDHVDTRQPPMEKPGERPPVAIRGENGVGANQQPTEHAKNGQTYPGTGVLSNRRPQQYKTLAPLRVAGVRPGKGLANNDSVPLKMSYKPT